MENTSTNSIVDKHKKRQNRLFYWSLFGFILFLLACIASEFRQALGFDPHWVGDNFAFNLMYLFPVTILSLIILILTATLTLVYWKTLENKTKKITSLIFSFSVILFVAFEIIRVWWYFAHFSYNISNS